MRIVAVEAFGFGLLLRDVHPRGNASGCFFRGVHAAGCAYAARAWEQQSSQTHLSSHRAPQRPLPARNQAPLALLRWRMPLKPPQRRRRLPPRSSSSLSREQIKTRVFKPNFEIFGSAFGCKERRPHTMGNTTTTDARGGEKETPRTLIVRCVYW